MITFFSRELIDFQGKNIFGLDTETDIDQRLLEDKLDSPDFPQWALKHREMALKLIAKAPKELPVLESVMYELIFKGAGIWGALYPENHNALLGDPHINGQPATPRQIFEWNQKAHHRSVANLVASGNTVFAQRLERVRQCSGLEIDISRLFN